MSLKSLLVRPWLAFMLIALVLITRTNFSTSIINAPDITLAAFFLAGLWIPSSLAFALLFGAAALADQLSFAGGISEWCFTPAYVFLIPTYACLWYAGFICRKDELAQVVGTVKLIVSLGLACVAAYAISTYSFFLFSGQLTSAQSVMAYRDGVFHYFPMYIGWAFFYAAVALVLALVIRTTQPAIWSRLKK